ncbi:MAG TPA: zinc-dependent metalloprotease, partial [Vicinamibacteria bacterium]|nr:zinc-dependent metalloprotease [Vicinamibacteria bacterium]
GRPGRGAECTMGQGLVLDAAFGLDVLAATGMERDGPEADEYIRQMLVHITAHEVGHTLGLRHNYAASTIRSMAELLDKSKAAQGITGSVMDYNPANIPLERANQGVYYQIDLGPYDYWAIEYAYKPIDAASPEAELAELRKIAARAVEAPLAYATDEDAGFSPEPWDMDPLVNRWDMGTDPLEFYAHRVKLSREVLKNVETRLERQGEGYQVLRRSVDNALGQAGYAMRMTAKYIGGVQHPRVHVGDDSGLTPLRPVAKARQQAALGLVRENLFSASAFTFSPSLLNKLASERFPNWRDFRSMQRRFDYPIHARVLGLQKSVLDRLLHPVVLGRVLDAEVKDPDPFTISMLFSGLQQAIWEDTKATGARLSINSYRRALQREHLSRLSAMVLRTQPDLPEDARTMARLSLTGLRSQLRGALARPAVKMPVETKAHLQESLARIDEVLAAKAERAAF